MDGTINAGGSFQHSTNMRLFIGGHVENMQFILGKIHGHEIILGHDWLMLHNPKIDWNDKHMSLTQCEKRQKRHPDTPCHILRTSTPMPDWEALYPKVFSEESYKELAKLRPGANCIIKFKKDLGYLWSKVYPLSAKERVALHQWITEDMKSGRLVIRLSLTLSQLNVRSMMTILT